MTIKDGWVLMRETFNEWLDDNAPRLGAALAYYTIFSITPLVIIAITIAGLVFDNAQDQVLGQIKSLVGEAGSEAIKAMIAAAKHPAKSILATLLALATLLFGAAGVFVQLKDALNTIWEVEPRKGNSVWTLIRKYLLSFTMVLGIGFLLLVSLLVASALSLLGSYLQGLFPDLTVILTVTDFVISFSVVTFLFAMLFKYLPDVEVSWKDVWLGAVLTALLFTVGKFLLGIYIQKAGIGSAYGAAGSLVIVVLWVYYSSQILFFGAEFTQVYSKHHGERKKSKPAENLPAKPPKKEKPASAASLEERKQELIERNNRFRAELAHLFPPNQS